jgi:hypothetical protein
MKCSVELDDLDANELSDDASLCGWTLACAHACSGDAARIGVYLGKGDGFDESVAAFACAYADQTERDYDRLVAAAKSGTIQAVTGI